MHMINTTTILFTNLSQTFSPSDVTFVTDLAIPQTLYLKDILLGRCYDKPPFTISEVNNCGPIVGGIMSVLEVNIDGNITSEVFNNYLNRADFSPPKDKAIISYGKSYTSGDEDDDFVTVENTPGGALLKDLTFCGKDNQELGCTFGELQDGIWHGAQAAFWFGALSKYIKKVEGHVRVVLEDSESLNEQGQILSTSMLKSMDANKVKSLEIIVSGETSCDSKTVIELQKSVILRGMKSGQVKCSETSSVKKSLYCTTTTSKTGYKKSTDNNSTNPSVGDSNCNSANDFTNSSSTSIIMLIIGFLSGILLTAFLSRKNDPSRKGYLEIPTHGTST